MRITPGATFRVPPQKPAGEVTVSGAHRHIVFTVCQTVSLLEEHMTVASNKHDSAKVSLADKLIHPLCRVILIVRAIKKARGW